MINLFIWAVFWLAVLFALGLAVSIVTVVGEWLMHGVKLLAARRGERLEAANLRSYSRHTHFLAGFRDDDNILVNKKPHL